MLDRDWTNMILIWLLLEELKEPVVNGGVLLDQGQVRLYYCSANIILPHCFCSLFPCQIWPSITLWFVSSRECSFWIELCSVLCSCSKNWQPRYWLVILQAVWVVHGNLCLIQTLTEVSVRWSICVFWRWIVLGEENGVIEILFQ